MTLSPIDLPDDGMRLIERGHIGQYGYTVQANHGLVARVVAERRMKDLIWKANGGFTRRFMEWPLTTQEG